MTRKSSVVLILIAIACLGVVSGASAQCAASAEVLALGTGSTGTTGIPTLGSEGAPIVGFPFSLKLSAGKADASAYLILSRTQQPKALLEFGVTLYPSGLIHAVPIQLDSEGAVTLFPVSPVPPIYCGLTVVAQVAIQDDLAMGGYAFSNALYVRFSGVAAAAPKVTGPVVTPTAAGSIQVTGTAVQPGNTVRIEGGLAVVTSVVGAHQGFTASVPLEPDALNPLSVREVFPGGVIGPSTVLAVVQDSSPPTLTIDAPTDGAVLGQASVTVLGHVSDSLSGLTGLTVGVNGLTAVVQPGPGTTGTFLVADVPLDVAGTTLLTATAIDKVGLAASTHVTVAFVPPSGAHLVAVSQTNLSGTVLQPLAAPIVVQFVDAAGQPLAGKPLTFSVVKSDGRLAAAPAGPGAMVLHGLTDAAGTASALWTLGTDAGVGNNRVRVTANGVPGSLTFCASAEAGVLTQLSVGGGNQQRALGGTDVPSPLSAWASDGDNGIASLPVTFTVTAGDGLVRLAGGPPGTSVTGITDGTGHVDVLLTVGPEPGPNAVTASVGGHAVTFEATGVGTPLVDTRCSGLVLDNALQPIVGATCRVTFEDGTIVTATTQESGTFAFTGLPQAGLAHLSVDGSTAASSRDGDFTFPSLAYRVDILQDAQNTLGRPILLPPLLKANEVLFDGTEDVVLQMQAVEGFKVFVPKETVVTSPALGVAGPDNPIPLSINPVHADRLPMPMPDGAVPPLAWTLQPGGTTFDPPLQIEYPNVAGLPAGSAVAVLSFNHAIGQFSVVASASVSADGNTIHTDPGQGLAVAGWGGFCPPYPPSGDATNQCSAGLDLTCCNLPGGEVEKEKQDLQALDALFTKISTSFKKAGSSFAELSKQSAKLGNNTNQVFGSLSACIIPCTPFPPLPSCPICIGGLPFLLMLSTMFNTVVTVDEAQPLFISLESDMAYILMDVDKLIALYEKLKLYPSCTDSPELKTVIQVKLDEIRNNVTAILMGLDNLFLSWTQVANVGGGILEKLQVLQSLVGAVNNTASQNGRSASREEIGDLYNLIVADVQTLQALVAEVAAANNALVDTSASTSAAISSIVGSVTKGTCSASSGGQIAPVDPFGYFTLSNIPRSGFIRV